MREKFFSPLENPQSKQNINKCWKTDKNINISKSFCHFEQFSICLNQMRHLFHSLEKDFFKGVDVAAGLTVGLQQLLLGGDGERAVFGRQHHGQTDVVLLGGRGPADHRQQSHRVRLRSSAEALHAEPGGVAQARRRGKQALPWRWRKRRRRRTGECQCSSGFTLLRYCCGGGEDTATLASHHSHAGHRSCSRSSNIRATLHRSSDGSELKLATI